VGQLFVDLRITMLAARITPSRAAGFRMIQAVLRTDCRSSHRVRTGTERRPTALTTVGVRQPLRVRSKYGADGCAKMALVVMVWATPDDGRFAALASRHRQPRTLDKLGSTVTI
jgi:hypothetical protein